MTKIAKVFAGNYIAKLSNNCTNFTAFAVYKLCQIRQNTRHLFLNNVLLNYVAEQANYLRKNYVNS